MYTIIEDASPYYIRFTFDGLDKIVDYVRAHEGQYNFDRGDAGYKHLNFKEDIAENIISMLPMSSKFTFVKQRVAVFSTPPAGASGIHKDGTNCRISFNIPIEVHDELCTTRWFTDEAIKDFPLFGLPYSRNAVGFGHPEFRKIIPIKEMVAKPNEAIFFNTDIFHCWDNISSCNPRKVLTLRINNPDDLKFEDVKQILEW
jgi:hypothetical protein